MKVFPAAVSIRFCMQTEFQDTLPILKFGLLTKLDPNPTRIMVQVQLCPYGSL